MDIFHEKKHDIFRKDEGGCTEGGSDDDATEKNAAE
jgi:hypothetical protein